MITGGIYAALWTPTDKEGHLIHDALSTIMQFLHEKGIYGFVSGGSTGEFFRLSTEFRKKLLEAVLERAKGLPVFTVVSAPVPQETKELIRHARAVKASAIMALPPMYYPVSQEDILEYYLDLVDAAAGVPLILYNYPECARNELSIETVRELIKRGAAAGIKQSGANFGFIKELVAAGSGKDFLVFAGADTKLPEAMKIGVSGCIGGLSNAIPDLSLEVFHRMKRGEEVVDLEEKLQLIALIAKEESFPYTAELFMEARGLPVGALKLPRSKESLKKHKELVEKARTLFQSWGW